MVASVISNVIISGITCVVPSREVCLSNNRLFNCDQKKLQKTIKISGFKNRRIVDEHICTSDLCYFAAEKLINQLKIERSKIDALIFVSQTPDYLMPATSFILQKRLNLGSNIAVMDINHGCSGYIYGLWLASSIINSGCKNVLLLVGDTVSKFKDMFREDQVPIFGDAGSATLITYTSDASKKVYFDIGSDGRFYDAIISKNGGFRNPPSPCLFYKNNDFMYESEMDGMQIMEFALNKVPISIENCLITANVDKSSIYNFILHQANKLILQNIAMCLKIPLEKVPVETLSKYGNQSSASIPATICDQLSDEVKNNSHEYVLSGFGIGLSWATCVITLDHLLCASIFTYED